GAAGPGRDRDDRSGDPVRLLVHRLGAAPGGSLGRGVGAQPLGLARHRCRGADPDGPRAACAADLALRLRMSATTPTSSTAPSRGARGFEAVLVIIYGLFALSATARSLVQILPGFDEPPVAYSLSLVAALTYIAATLLLVRRARRPSAVFALVMVELARGLAVSTLSVTVPSLFPAVTVSSTDRLGCGFVPLVVPVVALGYLLLSRRGSGPGDAGASPGPPAAPAP